MKVEVRPRVSAFFHILIKTSCPAGPGHDPGQKVFDEGWEENSGRTFCFIVAAKNGAHLGRIPTFTHDSLTQTELCVSVCGIGRGA